MNLIYYLNYEKIKLIINEIGIIKKKKITKRH